MKKTRLSHRILAMVLVVLMTVQLLPLSAFAAFGDLQSWNPGVDLSTLKQEDAINWPIKIYDYLSDGMLFEWMDTNTKASSSSPNIPYGHTDEGSVTPYGGGYKNPVTKLGMDYTYGSSNAWSGDYATAYYWNSSSHNYGKAYQLEQVDAKDYVYPMHIKMSGDIGSARNMMMSRFAAAQSTTGNIRYMVLVYRSKGLQSNQLFQIRASSNTSFSSWAHGYYSLPDSSEWTYQVIDLNSVLGTKTWVQYLWFAFYRTTDKSNCDASTAGFNGDNHLDVTHIGYFTNTTEAENYGKEAVKFDKNPGEYLGHSASTTYTHTTVNPAKRSDYLTNIFSLNYRWKIASGAADVCPTMFNAASNALNVRYGLDFTTHSVANGWKTNAYTSDTFWTWPNGTSLNLKNTVNNVTRTESFSMDKIGVTQHTQSNGAQFVRLTTNGPSKILLSKFREDHQLVQEGYVPFTKDVNYMVLVYRANGWTAEDKYALWAQGYPEYATPDGHKTSTVWKYAGLTKENDWRNADNVNPLTLPNASGWQYVVVDISAAITDENMKYLSAKNSEDESEEGRLANLGMYLPELSGDKSLDIAYVGFFKNNEAVNQVEDEVAAAFGTAAVKYMNAAATVTQDVPSAQTTKTYAANRVWHGGGNKSLGLLYSSNGGAYLPNDWGNNNGNSGGESTSTSEYNYGYEFDTWMIGYRTNAAAGNAFNTARYNLVWDEATGTYKKVRYTANYTPSGTGSGHSVSAFQYNATGTTNNIYFLAATEEGTTWGSNDGDTSNGQDFNTSKVKFDGYNLLETITSGVMTAGLLEGGLQTVVVNGMKYRVPIYRQETVEYIAYNLLYGLRIPMKDATGNYNTRFIKGTPSTKFGGVDLNGDGVIGWINYDGDSRNGNETNEASVDLATALRHELGLSPRLGNSVQVTTNASGGVSAEYEDFLPKMGNYQETLAKSRMLYGDFKDCRNAIETAMDAAYYLLNNLFISNSYNQEQDDYDYLTLSSAQVNALGHEGFAYVFDAGFTTGKTATYDTTFTDDGTNKSAINFDPYLTGGGGTGMISMEGVTGKTRFDYGTSGISWTTRFPFLPVTDAEGDFAGETRSYYFLDDAQRVYTEGSNTYKNRNFNYVIASNGEFVYREEDDLFFEFEGDDDVYLFINGQLVLDIGGAHSITSVYIDVNDYVNAAAAALKGLEQYGYHKDMSIDQFDEWISAANIQYLDKDFNPTGESVANTFTAAEKENFKRQHRLNLSDNQICQFDFYYMERHGWGANMRIVTNMHITDPSLVVDKTAHQFGEEIEYGGVIDPTASLEYRFKLTNTGNQKLYNLSWRDDVLGITMDPENGLVVGTNPDGLKMNGVYVMNSSGGYLQPKDMYAVVTGVDINGNQTNFRVTFDEVDGDGGQEALKKFLWRLESDDGTQSGYDDAEVTNAGSGLWVGGSVQFCGIYYMLTPNQTNAGQADNTVYLTATTKIDPNTVGNRTLRSDDSHRLYTNGFPIHYQWAGHEIFMNMEHLLEEAVKESDRDGSQLSLYEQFFNKVTLSTLITEPCDKFGRVGGDYSDFLTKRDPANGYQGYYINYKEPGVYTFYLLMYRSNGKDVNGNAIKTGTVYNASNIAEGDYAILRSQVFVADVKDSVYVLDYGLSTESLDADGLLFKDDYLFGPNGLIRAKLMGITGGKDDAGNKIPDPEFRHPSAQADPTKTGIYFTALDKNRIYTENGFFNSNLPISADGKEIAYDSNKDEYTLTGVGTMTVKAVLPTTDAWSMPYLYYWYDDGTTGPSWPGTPMKSMGAGNYQIDIPADVANVIINNGSAALKTNDIQITPGLENTITVTVNNNVVSHKVDTIMEEVTMHVKVPADWGKVYLHHWHDNGESTVFPGDELTEMDANGYYTIKLHGDVSNLLIANGAGKQTGNLTVFAGKEVWIDVSSTVTGTATDEFGNVTTSYYAAGIKYTLTESFIVRASVPAGWKEKVYLYYWRADGTENAPWPGEEMIKGDLWYTCKTNVPADVSHIIINDGNDGDNHQTLNLTVTPGLETWIMVQNETKLHNNQHKYTAKIAYGSDSTSTGLTFTPTEFLDQENVLWLAITVHSTSAHPTAINGNIDIHNEVQMYKKVTVLPATVVYYEDTFGAVEYNKNDANSKNVFSHHGNGSGQLSQSVDQDQPYGQDSAYQGGENDLYSGGSLTEVTILDDKETTVATFDFKGTGFELVGRTNAADSASFMVRVYKKANYSADAYQNYLNAAWAYLNAYTLYSDVYTAYSAAVKAYDKATAAYTAAVDAYNAAVVAYNNAAEDYQELLTAAQAAFKAYSRACDKYKAAADSYEDALQAYKGNDAAITVVSNVGSSSYQTSAELVDPSTLFVMGAAPTAPQAPEMLATMTAPTPITAPFIIAKTTYTQFDHGNDGGAESINQVPVARVEGLERLDEDGNPIEYVVEVSGIPMFEFDPNNNYAVTGVKPTKLYIDGIRIFQPMGATNPAYNDKENGAKVEEIQDLIANGTIGVGVMDGEGLSVSTGTITWTESMWDNDFNPSNKETFHSIKVDSTSDYLIQGPNNEVYMEGNANNSGLIFYVKPVAGAKITELQIAARALDYGRYYGAGSTALNVQLQYGVLVGNDYKWENLVHIVSGTEQYYSIPYEECPVDTEGRYQIVLRAINPHTGANAMVSYTSLKINGLTLEKADGIGEGSVIYYENGVLVKPQYEMVIIPDASFVTAGTHKFDGNELTLTLDSDAFYFYITSTQGGEKSEFYAHEDPGQATSATLWKYDANAGYSKWSFDILNQSGSEVTFTIKQTDGEKLVVSYCIHTYGEGVITREPNCSIVGIKAYTCTKCDHVKEEFLDTNGKHHYSGGVCSYCSAKEPKFYLVGSINGVDYGFGADAANMGQYLFVDGKLRVKFAGDSYVFVKADGNKAWYMSEKYVTSNTGTFYNTAGTDKYGEKMYVQGDLELIFTLVVNDDGSVTLSYEEPCVHDWGTGFVTWAPTCTADGERTFTCSKCFEMKTELIPATGHDYENGLCVCGDIEYRTIYFRNTDNWTHVYLYAWTDDGQEYSSKWPGDVIDPVEGEDGIYSVTLPSYLNIVFNNNAGTQTENLEIPSDADMFDWSSKLWVNHSGELHYYLVGNINGVDYGIGDNRNNMGVYKFVDGKLVATFKEDSYVMVKTTGNANWFASRDTSVEYASEEILHNTRYFVDARQQLKVPGGVELTFTLVVNEDDTVTLAAHSWGSVVVDQPSCTEDGKRVYTCNLCNDSYEEAIPALGHSYNSEGDCACGAVKTRTIYFHNTAGWENVFIYAWIEGVGEYTNAWPGNQMTLVEGTTDLYSYVLSVKARGVIFNNGVGNQTDNLTIPSNENINKFTFGAGLDDRWKPKDEVVELDTLYLDPGDQWPSDNAWFAAYFFNGNKNVWFKMTDSNGDGTYECPIPDGFTNVIFCRMNKAATGLLHWDNKWNQTGDLTLDLTNNGDQFTITGPWDGGGQGATGTWSTYVAPVCQHSYTEEITTAAGCETIGVKTFTCSKCGDSYTEEIAATGHTNVVNVITEATCTTAGQQTVTCTTCGASSTEEIPATGHSYTDGVCTVCGGSKPLTIYFLNNWLWSEIHVYYWNDQGNNADWPGEAMTYYGKDSSGNHDVYSFTVPAGMKLKISGIKNDGSNYRDETPEITGYVDGNCYSMAWRDGNAVDVQSITVVMCSHSYQENIITPATCTTAGEKSMTCSLCGNSYTETINATGHNFVDGTCANGCGTAEPTEAVVLYLKPNNYWSEGTPRYAAYFYNGSGDTWVDMTDADADGIYECVVPEGYNMVIFCRMNGGASDNNWGNKWNQTGDLSVPTDGNTLCTIPDNQWDCGIAVSWSAMTTKLTLRSTRSIVRAMSGAEEQTVVLPEVYINGDEDVAMNLSSIHAQLSSDLVVGELDIITKPDEEVVVNIDSAAPVLSDDIRLNFYVTVPENAENVYMTFTFNGEMTKVNGGQVGSDGRLYFTFEGINPQTMGDAINATLYATVNGQQYVDVVTDYSMVKYCTRILERSTDPDMITLISDLLVYGAKTQIVQNYKIDELVTEGLMLTPSTFPGLDESFNKLSVQGQPSADVAFTGVTLKLSGKMTLCLTVKTDDPSAYTFRVRVAGVEQSYTAEDLVPAGNGLYMLYFDELKATCFNETIVASIECDGETVGSVVSYSVNTYVQRKQNTADPAVRELLEAIYNYGNSARILADKRA